MFTVDPARSAAIPAVIGYNYLTARVRTVDNGAMAFISEFGDTALEEGKLHEGRPGARGAAARSGSVTCRS